MKRFALLSATAFLLTACAVNTPQIDGVSPSTRLNIDNGSGSFVGKKVNEFTKEYNIIHDTVNKNALKLIDVNQSNDEANAEYAKIIDMIETKLAEGTTSSNPDLVKALAKAQENLEILELGTQKLATISANVIAEQEKLNVLYSMVNATYALPGAYDIDHSNLNELITAISQQERTNADIIAYVKSNIANQQHNAENFRDEITSLNVGVAAGYFDATPVKAKKLELISISPVSVETAPAKDKSLRSTKRRVKLAKKIGVITEENISSKKEINEKSNSVSKIGETSKKIQNTEKSKKLQNKKKPSKLQNAEKSKKLQSNESKKTDKVKKASSLQKGEIFSKDFANDDVEYFYELENAVRNTLINNPDTKFIVTAYNPMDTVAQDRVQSMMAKIFGDMLALSVPAENLHVNSVMDINRKVPTIKIFVK